MPGTSGPASVTQPTHTPTNVTQKKRKQHDKKKTSTWDGVSFDPSAPLEAPTSPLRLRRSAQEPCCCCCCRCCCCGGGVKADPGEAAMSFWSWRCSKDCLQNIWRIFGRQTKQVGARCWHSCGFRSGSEACFNDGA